jgi:hypothetical protein
MFFFKVNSKEQFLKKYIFLKLIAMGIAMVFLGG